MYPVQAPRRCSATHEAQRRDPSERFDRRSGWDWQGPSPQGGASWLTPEAPRPLQPFSSAWARRAPPAPTASTPAVPARPRRASTQARLPHFGASPGTTRPARRLPCSRQPRPLPRSPRDPDSAANGTTCPTFVFSPSFPPRVLAPISGRAPQPRNKKSHRFPHSFHVVTVNLSLGPQKKFTPVRPPSMKGLAEPDAEAGRRRPRR